MNTVGSRIKERRKELKLTQEELAKRTCVTKSSISQWENNLVKLNGENLLVVSQRLLVSPDWLLHGDEKASANKLVPLGKFEEWGSDTPLDDDEIEIPFYKDVTLAAGDGKICDSIGRSNLKLRFSRATLKRQGIQIDTCVCFTVHGNSMEPILPNGCTVGIDQSKTTIVDGKIYAINQCGELRLKMLYKIPGGGIRMRSYNADEYAEEIYDAQQTKDIVVIGRLFWCSVLFN